jgi:hypothetical protein
MTSDIKGAKSFFRKEIETAHETLTAEIVEMRDTMRLFKTQTKEKSTGQANQIEQLHGGALMRMATHFDSTDRAVSMMLNEECPRVFFPVTDEKRKELHKLSRKVKHGIRAIMDTAGVQDQDLTVVLASFWSKPDGGDKTRVDKMLDDLKAFQEAMKKFKGAVQRHIKSAEFTRTIHKERLIDKYNIGNAEHEGEVADGNDDIGDDPEDDGVSNKIVYDKKKKNIYKDDKDIEKVVLEESRQFIDALEAKKNFDDDDLEDVSDGSDGDDDDDDDDVNDENVAKPKKYLKRGGKMLRPRKILQRENFKKMAGDIPDIIDDEGDDAASNSSEDEEDGNNRAFKPKEEDEEDDDDGDDDDDFHDSCNSEESGDGDNEEDEEDDDGDAGEDDEDESEKQPKQKIKTEIKGKIAASTTSNEDENSDDDDEVEAKKHAKAIKKEKKPNGVSVVTPPPKQVLKVGNVDDGTESDTPKPTAPPPTTTQKSAVVKQEAVEEIDDFFM